MMPRKPNRLLALLEKKQIPLGIQMFTGSHALMEVLGETGFDFVMIDTEHSDTNVRALEGLIRTAELAGVIRYVRGPDLHNEVDIRRALEAGAEGLFLPLVQSAADIDRVAEFALIPPRGKRGICPAVRAAGYSMRSFDKYVVWNNEQVALIPMIESQGGVDDIEAICAHPEVDMLVFAPGDLAFQLGEGSQMMRGPKVQAAYRKVLDAAKRHGVHLIGGPILDPTPASCRKFFDDGIRIFTLGLDTLGFRRFCESTVKALNEGMEGTGYTRPPAPDSGFPG